MLLDYKNGQTSVVFRVKIRDSSKTTGAGLTGLTGSSSGLIISTIADNEALPTVYTAAATHIQTIATLGTFAAPSASCCRFAEVDSTNHKGVYEIQIADARFAVSGAKSLLVSISGATNCVETEVLIPLRSVDPYSAASFMTGVNGLAPPTNWNLQSIDASGRVDLGKILGTASQGAAGSVGIDWSKIANATSTVNLSSTTVSTITTAPDSAGTGTMLGRLTSARAGYLDNINVGGAVASHADITGLDVATPLAQLSWSSVFQKPGSGTEPYQILLITRAMGSGALTDIDGGVGGITSVVTNAAGTDRSAKLGTWTHVSTGIYSNTYTVSYNDPNESLMMRFSGTVGSNGFVAPATPIVAEYSEFNATYASYLTALYNVCPAFTPLVDSAGKMTLSPSQSFNNTGQTTKNAATLSSTDMSGVFPANTTQWGGSAVTGMPLPTGSYTDPPSAPAIRAEIDSNSTQLAALVAGVTLSSTSSPAQGLVVSGSTASSVVVSGLPAGRNYIGQRLYHQADGEARVINSQSYSSPNYTFTFGSGSNESGPFSVNPTAGDVVIPIP